MTDRAPLEVAEKRAQEIGQLIRKAMPKGWGFLLHLVSYGEEGYATYVSSVERDDAIRMVQEWLELQKGRSFDSFDIGDSCWCCGSKQFLNTATGPLRSVIVCSTCWCKLGTGGKER